MSENNLVVLRGVLRVEAQLRELPSGTVLGQFDVTTRDAAGTQNVPVAWFDPPGSVADLPAGTDVVVVGSVRRRFYRAGGGLQSRTEVVAEKLVPARRRAEVRRAIEAAGRVLHAAPGESEEVAMPAR